MMILIPHKSIWLTISVIWLLLESENCNAWLGGSSMTRQGISATKSFSSSAMTKLQYTKDDNNDKSSGESNNDKKREEEAEARRMEAVRSLQLAFYKSDAQKDTPATTTNDDDIDETTTSNSNDVSPDNAFSMARLEASTGRLHSLPLWRAPWWEVPGRSNVLNVHDPIYTNMFEQIIRKPKPWCFGHLFLKGGSDNLKPGGLATWENYGQQSKCAAQQSAVMGCLMHIQDYRRFSNGRLLLLVHAMERFVVTDIQQELPFSIVDAQVLPDPEELDPSFIDLSFQETTATPPENQQLLWQLPEDDLSLTRGMAVQESVRYHDYEYDPEQDLSGISNKTYLEPTDILWSSIARLLPFCPFAKTLSPPLEMEVKATLQQHFGTQQSLRGSNLNATTTISSEQDKQQPSLESQLFSTGILRAPLFDPEYATKYDDMSSDELEYELWLAMNRYLTASKIPISPIVLGLLPRRDLQVNGTTTTTNLEDWPADFQIYNIVRDLEATQIVPTNTTNPFGSSQSTTTSSTLRHKKARHDFVRVHPHYPKHRRQKRLSYSALSLLEKSSDQAKLLRPEFLATPSTKQRLRLVLEKLDQWQEEFWGEFQ